MIFTTDSDGAIDYICMEWMQYAGQSRADVYADGWLAPIVPSDRNTVSETLSKAARAQSEFSIRFRVDCADGTTRWLSAGGVPSFGPPDHSFLGYLGSMTEFAPTEAQAVAAYGQVGRFIPPPSHPATQPVSRLEMIADYLIMTHSLIEQGEAMSALEDVRRALSKVGRALASGEGSRTSLH